MTTQNLALFKAMGAKMDYLNQRQRVISQNIANTDTPGYRPQDLVDADFSRVLKGVVDSKRSNVQMETTQRLHMPPPNEVQDPRSKKQKETYEVAPAGNSVIMEEQLINAGETVMQFNLMTNLYQKNVGLIRQSLGGGR